MNGCRKNEYARVKQTVKKEGVGATVGKMVACKTRQQTETVKKKELPVWVFNIVGLVS